MAKTQCAETIFNSSVYRSFPCSVGATVQDGSNWWCGIHSPEAKQRRKAKRDARHAKWTAEFEAGIKHREAAQSERDALAESHAELVEALARALPVALEAHGLVNHGAGAPPGRCHICEEIADDRAVLDKARKL